MSTDCAGAQRCGNGGGDGGAVQAFMVPSSLKLVLKQNQNDAKTCSFKMQPNNPLPPTLQ
jgi:hypothetical protein